MAVVVVPWMVGANESNPLTPKVVGYFDGDLMSSLLLFCRVDRCSNLTSKSKLPVVYVREPCSCIETNGPPPPSVNHVIPQAQRRALRTFIADPSHEHCISFQPSTSDYTIARSPALPA